MRIEFNSNMQYPEEGNFQDITVTDRGQVCIGAKIVGRLVEDTNTTNIVSVRWHDGYLEEFKATEVRFGSDLLWIRLVDGKNRHIPLRSVRWFGMTQESHQSEKVTE